MTAPTTFAVVGTGWRAGFFARAATRLPSRFTLQGMISHSDGGARVATDGWHVPAYPTVDALLAAGRPDFVVVSVPWEPAVEITHQLVAAGMAVLAETPPAPDVEGLVQLSALVDRGARIQVAEQYPWQPLHAARLAITDSGLLGPLHEAALSVAHGYHAFSLMRRHLGVVGEQATIRAMQATSPVQTGSSRGGPRTTPGTTASTRTYGIIDFGDRAGIYDFSDTQYWSYGHRHHVVLRGRDGELADETVRYVIGLDQAVTVTLNRETTGVGGNMAGQHLAGISGADRWWWRNPFPGVRMFDDEVAVATVMELMAAYTDGGLEFYGVADAAQDHYLGLALRQAAESGETVTTTPQAWHDQLAGSSASQARLPAPVIDDVGPDDVAPLR